MAKKVSLVNPIVTVLSAGSSEISAWEIPIHSSSSYTGPGPLVAAKSKLPLALTDKSKVPLAIAVAEAGALSLVVAVAEGGALSLVVAVAEGGALQLAIAEGGVIAWFCLCLA